jgi:hypothetical protein
VGQKEDTGFQHKNNYFGEPPEFQYFIFVMGESNGLLGKEKVEFRSIPI